jgi:tetratricopeptide (TPR) repeat protein
MWETGPNDGQPTDLRKEVVFLLSDYTSREEAVKYFTKTATRYFKAGCERLLIKNSPEKALECFNRGIRYMPNDKNLLLLRGLCLFELGDSELAQKDWNRIAALGGIQPGEVDNQIARMKGYQEMDKILPMQ